MIYKEKHLWFWNIWIPLSECMIANENKLKHIHLQGFIFDLSDRFIFNSLISHSVLNPKEDYSKWQTTESSLGAQPYSRGAEDGQGWRRPPPGQQRTTRVQEWWERSSNSHPGLFFKAVFSPGLTATSQNHKRRGCLQHESDSLLFTPSCTTWNYWRTGAVLDEKEILMPFPIELYPTRVGIFV